MTTLDCFADLRSGPFRPEAKLAVTVPLDLPGVVALTLGQIASYIHCMNRSRIAKEASGVSAPEVDSAKLAGRDLDALAIHDARVFKAGNSLAIRIPSAVAKHVGLEDGCAVEMAVDGGDIRVRKSPSDKLSELIERITPENVHAPVFDDTVGSERWQATSMSLIRAISSCYRSTHNPVASDRDAGLSWFFRHGPTT